MGREEKIQWKSSYFTKLVHQEFKKNTCNNVYAVLIGVCVDKQNFFLFRSFSGDNFSVVRCLLLVSTAGTATTGALELASLAAHERLRVAARSARRRAE